MEHNFFLSNILCSRKIFYHDDGFFCKTIQQHSFSDDDLLDDTSMPSHLLMSSFLLKSLSQDASKVTIRLCKIIFFEAQFFFLFSVIKIDKYAKRKDIT